MNAMTKAFADMICKDDQIIKLQRRVAELERANATLRGRVDYLTDLRRGVRKRPDCMAVVADVCQRVADRHGVAVADISVRSQRREVSRLRQEVMYEAHCEGVPNRQIGAYFGMDHSTVRFGVAAEKARRDEA